MQPNTDFTFSVALEEMRLNEKKVARRGWNGKGMWLEIQVPDMNSKMTLPYIYLNYPAQESTNEQKGRGEQRVPWLASQTDMLSSDWYIVE